MTAVREPGSEEASLAADLLELDERTPGWEEVTRLAGARNALRIGLPREAIKVIYGDALIRQAEDTLPKTTHSDDRPFATSKTTG